MNRQPTAPNAPRDWRQNATCREYDPELFFPAGETGIHVLQAREAKAVCRRCPVMETCLNWAMETRQQGVWGGTTETDRDSLRRRAARRRNRPAPAPARTEQTAFEDRTIDVGGGHLEWLGSEPVTINNRAYTIRRLAWYVAHGEHPTGTLKLRCDHKGCVAPDHLRDLGPTQNGCGTRPGYQAHRARGEDACDPCKGANASADRLRITGSTKQLTA